MNSEASPPRKHSKGRSAWSSRSRRWLRALHRDLGYLSVGLTVVYAVSGVAVNHIDDWEPNQRTLRGELALEPAPQSSSEEIAMWANRKVLGSNQGFDPRSVYRDEQGLEFQSGQTRFQVDFGQRVLRWERDEDRFFVKAANWLHLNRGKAAWTYIADSYAVALLTLALSGMWMIPGRRGFFGRGLLLVALGAAVPTLYVHFAR